MNKLDTDVNISACEENKNKHLKSEFVEAEVDEVFDAGQDAVVEVLPRDAVEDDAEGRRLQVVTEAEVELVAMDGCLEDEQPEHHQMVLQQEKYLNCG